MYCFLVTALLFNFLLKDENEIRDLNRKLQMKEDELEKISEKFKIVNSKLDEAIQQGDESER